MAGARGHSWWKMTWRRDPPGDKDDQTPPIVPAGLRRTPVNTPKTPNIRQPATDFADPLAETLTPDVRCMRRYIHMQPGDCGHPCVDRV